MRKIRAIIKRPDEEFGHVTNISDTLKNLQNIVEGYIETVSFGDFTVICNEEGLIQGLDYNCEVKGFSFVGNIIVVGTDGDEFSDCPLSLKEWKELIQ